MNRKGALTVGTILLLIIGVLVAVSLFPTIANNVKTLTAKSDVVDETLTITSARLAGGQDINATKIFTVTHYPTGNYDDCALESITISNSSGTDLTLTTDYLVYANNGTITFKNTSATAFMDDNTTLLDYTYCQEGYVDNTGGRAMASLILLFAAVGLLAFVIWYGIKEYL